MNFIGVDACKKGWFAVALDRQDNWDIGTFKTIDAFWDVFQNATLILIDMPIGLPAGGKRRCDIETRKILGPRASSVFPVPCREALQAKTYDQACRINQRVMGVRLTIQTWNICAKILEVDQLLCNNKLARRRIRESHPELCFWSLAGGRPMVYSKKRPQGFSERYSILKKIYLETSALVRKTLDTYMRKDLARDDILDALALAVCARQPLKSIKTIPPNPPRNANGLPVEIVYTFRPYRSDKM